MEREILLLGDPRLYEVSAEVKQEELETLRPVFSDMFDCIRGIRRDYGFGRAIAAPQIGVQKRLICMLTDRPYVIINPSLEFVGDEMMELMDDCMSSPKSAGAGAAVPPLHPPLPGRALAGAGDADGRRYV